MYHIMNNIIKIKKQITELSNKYSREKDSITLLAVTKTRSIEEIKETIKTGQKDFAENYLQEALNKINTINNPNVTWHFIGHIQTNKCKKIAKNFSWVHSVDSFTIAKKLNDYRPTDLPKLNICIEVKLEKNPQKSGVAPSESLPLCQSIMQLPNLKLRGLMIIPEPSPNLNSQRAKFRELAELQKKLQSNGIALDTLSMGMSDDYEAAIAEGATIIRIGRAIFGEKT
ncbi:MAG: YggS family pyridoxal phosphate-dependent enzyme [Gammaproteobacteria bacterium]|nr:YggS family pyridoxal phosphate-dependent enzyme [Gammaproteobacteria bacterium]